MSEPATVYDTVYRASFARSLVLGWRSNKRMRDAIVSARRFVLDEEMSRFLADLSLTAFIVPAARHTRRIQSIENIRRSARLPHSLTWIEYDQHAYGDRKRDLLAAAGQPMQGYNPSDTPAKEGWLLQQHPTIDTAFTCYVFNTDPLGRRSKDGDAIAWTHPAAYSWRADDGPMPFAAVPMKARDRDNPDAESEEVAASTIITGLNEYDSPQVCINAEPDLITRPQSHTAVADLIQEWAGILRRVWALLATVNDVPILRKDVTTSRGFMAPRHGYRKFLSHTSINLNVPMKVDRRRLARSVVATMQRRAHEVRGHWRIDWRAPPSALCEHNWNDDNVCRVCRGHRLWISEHVRGDTSKGFVTHDYQVHHEE